MSDPSVEDAVKRVVLANADGDIKAIAVVMVNNNSEPEMFIGMPLGTAYTVIASLDILKNRIIEKVVREGGIEPKDRE